MEIFEMLLNSLSWIFILAGSFLMVLGAIGILRFRGFWARLHAASVIESGGVIFLLAGMCLHLLNNSSKLRNINANILANFCHFRP